MPPRRRFEVNEMPMWAWILLIILLVLLVTGGIGYGRR
jgi:cytochrome b subunit of formate dehydrogenase